MFDEKITLADRGSVVPLLTVIIVVILSFLFLNSPVYASPVEITYEATEIGPDHWQILYGITNISLDIDIEEVTIWFDHGLYDNLQLASDASISSSWDEIVWQPDHIIGDDGGYDVLALDSGIATSETVSGFSVTFDWFGNGEPGSQYYEIINTVTFGTSASGYTIPEPATCLLLLSGGVLLRRRK